MPRGRFLSLEGGEGAGKSTQARALAAALRDRGVAAVITREPGGSPGAEAIRALLLEGESGRWSARAETLLFAAARADHLEKVIRPALENGCWVICDRFVDSTRAYQGVAGGVADAEVLALHAFGSEGLLPDRTFLLTLPLALGAERAARRDRGASDRFAARESDFHAAVGAAFERFAEAEPDRFRRIDAAQPPAAVTAAMLAALADWLP
ncbi:dTMP kinase [Sphingomonas sp. RHCKR7]|uniref:dTMP kinase n=1 Tax=Sphingomonas folli TaxID=2862497 RepID=UPI001CA5B982|nr:dTMP kinase [Sphingomonas folli]MBW6525732.1 dTMP kinase [Sphingomonas folli]